LAIKVFKAQLAIKAFKVQDFKANKVAKVFKVLLETPETKEIKVFREQMGQEDYKE